MSSDDTGTNSLFSNLKNKVAYKIHNATYDPAANKFSKEQKEQKEQTIQKEKNNDAKNTDGDTTDDNTTLTATNNFNATRLAKKVGSQTVDTLKKILLPFTSLMLAMIVTNEMIVYSFPIRIIFFIFTFVVCYFTPIMAIALSVFYILKGGYSYYYNNMTDRVKKDIMPTIFALLPITTHKSLSPFGAFFMYPFTYPKTEKAAIKLPEIMKQYWQDLQNSFKDLDRVKNLPIFADDLKHIQKELSLLHSTNINITNTAINNETITS